MPLLKNLKYAMNTRTKLLFTVDFMRSRNAISINNTNLIFLRDFLSLFYYFITAHTILNSYITNRS